MKLGAKECKNGDKSAKIAPQISTLKNHLYGRQCGRLVYIDCHSKVSNTLHIKSIVPDIYLYQDEKNKSEKTSQKREIVLSEFLYKKGE